MFLIILVILFAFFIFIRFFILEKQNKSGRLRILSTPATTVFIDNVAVGKTPYEEKANVGEYIIKLIPDGEGATTAVWQSKVKVFQNSMTYINQDLKETEVTSAGEILTITKMDKKSFISQTGEVYVETEPNGVIVYLDNDEKGVSTLLLENVTRGDHEISVFMPGFIRRTQKINVEDGYRVNVHFKLALDPSNKTLDKTLEEKRQEASEAAELAATPVPLPTNILIGNTPTGFLRVRSEPTVSSSEIAQVRPGETYVLLEELNGWYKIKVNEKEGWISAQYSTKQLSTSPASTASPSASNQ